MNLASTTADLVNRAKRGFGFPAYAASSAAKMVSGPGVTATGQDGRDYPTVSAGVGVDGYATPVTPASNVPQSNRPKANPATPANPFAVANAGWAGIGQAANDAANSANSGFGGGFYTGAAGNPMASGANSYQNVDAKGGNMNGQSWLPYRPPYQPQAPINLGVGQRQARFLEQGFLNAPQDVADGINGAFDQYQYYADKAANRDLIKSLLGGLGGGNRMQGFVDVNSGQAASLPGQTTNAITAQALSPQAIAGAAQQARGAQSAPASQASAPMPQGAAAEVNAIAQQAAGNRGAQNANTIERSLTADNAQLQRAIELAKAKQGLGNAGFLTDLNMDNARYRVGMQTPIIKSLLGALA